LPGTIKATKLTSGCSVSFRSLEAFSFTGPMSLAGATPWWDVEPAGPVKANRPDTADEAY